VTAALSFFDLLVNGAIGDNKCTNKKQAARVYLLIISELLHSEHHVFQEVSAY